jgi:hypothetical protein
MRSRRTCSRPARRILRSILRKRPSRLHAEKVTTRVQRGPRDQERAIARAEFDFEWLGRIEELINLQMLHVGGGLKNNRGFVTGLFHELVCNCERILLVVCWFHKPMNAKDVPSALKCLLLFVLLSFTPNLRGAVLAQWDFNTNPPDPTNSFTTGSTNPISGVFVSSASATLAGGTTATFASGSGSTDPVQTDDSAWNTATYAPQSTSNKMRGVQFNVSTLGYERIIVTWDHRHSSTSSRYIRFQYSTNGLDFLDGPVLSTTTEDLFTSRSIDLSAVPLVNNRADFAFRVVAEFEDTATGSGAAAYVATRAGQTYSPNGTWRFDMVTVSGEVFSGNEFPSISTISNQTIRMDMLSPEFPFTIGDLETAAEDLIVTASSSDLVLLPNENIFVAGTGSNWTVRVFPASGQSGNVTVTLTVTDELGNGTSTSFVVTVLPNNTAPTISSFTNYHTVAGIPLAPIAFVIGDAESQAASLTVTATSSNPTLIPDGNIVRGGTESNRTLTITPAQGQAGNAVITITVSDSELSTNRQFAVMVVPSTNVVLFEPFEYADGPVNVNSAFRWSNHSGIAGQTQITAGELRLSSAQTEDTSSAFIGGPFAPDSGRTLYSAFTVNFKTLPTSPGEYFAHFMAPGSGGAFRARLFAITLDVTAGFYRLAIGNTAPNITNTVAFPVDLALETEYLVVVRYDVGTGSSTLWVNPRAESDPSVTATDATGVTSINAWAFRQSNTANGNMGTLHIDDLSVGFTFIDVVPGYRLSIARNGSALEISWPAAATDEGYVLESTADLNAPFWGTVTDVPFRNGATDSVVVSSPASMRFYRLVK